MRPWDEPPPPPDDDWPRRDGKQERLENLIFCGAAAFVVAIILITMGR